jgi:3-oxoadipate enol-lactonase
MPTVNANSISISYELHQPSNPDRAFITSPFDSEHYIVLINGLADPKETWSLQIPALTNAGLTVLTFDNRGIGSTSSPAGPYTASLLAADAKALVTHLKIPSKFHLMGVSMGGMIAQQYALDYPADILSLTLACTYAAPGPFCSRMFSMWADTAPVMGVPFVMRDVTLWAFTQDFFTKREDELREVETNMKYMTQSTPAYLAQLAVIQNFDTTERLHQIKVPTLVLAGEQDILIPVSLSRELHEAIPGSRWKTVLGGHGCMWEYPGSFNETCLEFLQSFESKSKND